MTLSIWAGKATGGGIPALLAFFLPLGLVLVCLVALWSVAQQSTSGEISTLSALKDLWSDIYITRAIRFTVWQAVLSAILSTFLAIPLARALASRRFPGRNALLSVLGAPFILPVIVAILGLLAIWGRGGPVNLILTSLGFKSISIYGLSGILLAHIFFNLPLATRILLAGWLAIPPEQWRLAAQLGLPGRTIARHIEWPMLKERLPGALALIFLLCVSSFTVILALGGGPKATTIELAIYQAIRYDFELHRAALLALAQIILCAGLAGTILALAKEHDAGHSLGGYAERPDRAYLPGRLWDAFVILVVIILLGSPLIASLARGLSGLITHGVKLDALLPAIGRSLLVSFGAATTMLVISLPLAQASLYLGGAGRFLIKLPGFAIMVAPPIALGAGLFILLFPYASVDDLALPLAALLNGLQAIPFALILIAPAMQTNRRLYGRLSDHLGLKGWSAIRHIHWPLLRRPIGLSLGLAAALSMGDLGVIALFGSPTAPTLPLYLYQQMGAYHMDEAYGSALILVSLAFGLFVFFDKGLGGRDQA